MSNPSLSLEEKTFLMRGRDREDRDGHWHDINWTWADEEKEMWKPLRSDHDLQKFYNYWRNRPDDPDFLQKCPYRLPSKKGAGPPLPLLPEDTSGNQILVIDSYNELLHRLIGRRMGDTGKARGAVLTGQPGTGAPLCWIPAHSITHWHTFYRKNYVSEFHVCPANLK
jgi:hypothetical protein